MIEKNKLKNFSKASIKSRELLCSISKKIKKVPNQSIKYKSEYISLSTNFITVYSFILAFLILQSVSGTMQTYPSKKIYSNNRMRELNCLNQIILTVAGKGTQYIFFKNETAEEMPPLDLLSQILLNGVEIDKSDNFVSTQDENHITLIWSTQLTTCYNMFKNLKNIESVDLTNFDFNQVISLESFFEGCSSLKSVDFGNADAKAVRTMRSMFNGCNSLISLNIGSIQTEQLIDLTYTFNDCKNIISIDLSSFNTPDLLYAPSTFRGCSSIKEIKFGPNFQTSKVIHMERMFQDCRVLESLDLSNFNTENVLYMDSMFDGCNSIESLDLSSFKTPSLKTISNMFNTCYKLKDLNIINFNTTLVEDMGKTFDQCWSLTSINLTHFDTQSLTIMYHMF